MIAPLSSLLRHHIATPTCPLPAPAPGITWVFAANGLFKRGSNADLDILVAVAEYAAFSPSAAAVSPPGLATLMPGVRYHAFPHRLPGQLLAAMLAHARKAGRDVGQGLLGPVEVQYHVTLEAGRLRVRVPPQDGTSGRVTYQPPHGVPILLDLHSHHGMPAFFSSTDDRDDTGLGVSAVIGKIFDAPEIAVRLCCYGHTRRVPALSIFDSLPGCRDTYGGL